MLAGITSSRAARPICATLLLCAGYYVGGVIGIALRFEPGGISGIWLPHGILTATLLLSRPRSWWIYAVALLPTHFHLVHTFQGSVPWTVMSIQYAGNFAQAMLAAAVLRRVLGDPPRLNSLARMGVFLAASCLAPCLVSVFVAWSFMAVDWVADFWTAWQRRTFSQMCAAAIIAPPIVHLATGGLATISRAPRRRVVEFVLLTTGLVVMLLASLAWDRAPSLLFATLPFLLWSAVRFGSSGVGLHLLAVTLITLLTTKEDLGVSTATQVVVSLHGYTLAVSIPLMLLAALVEQYEQAAASLTRSQTLYRSVVEDQAELICRFLRDGTYTFVNGAYCRYFGRTPEELIGQTFWQFIPPDQHASSRAFLASITPEHPVSSVEHKVTRADGAVCWHHWVDRGFFDDTGQLIEFQAVGHDITERKNAEERERQLVAQRQVADALQDVDRRKDEFLAMLAHELRNPLAPINNAIEILRKSASGDDQVVHARDVIARQTKHLTQLVDDLLDVARITQGKIKLSLSPLYMAHVVAQAVETTRPLFESRKHALSLDLPSDAVRIRGDRVRLIQIVSNLLNNAAKYTAKKGSIALSVRQVGEQIILKVIDNGIGMPVHMLERVFDMFIQVETSSVQPREGLGIGLALVKRLVEMHDGSIEAHSEGLGRGCEIVVRLPAMVGADAESNAGERVIADPQGTRRKRVLVVDDNVDAADTLSLLLRLEQHEVIVAYDGIEALETAREMDPDVIFLDLGLPRLDGVEVAKQLRKETDRPVLLVALTGFGQASDRAQTRAAGFNHHLTKPVDFQVVRSLVRDS